MSSRKDKLEWGYGAGALTLISGLGTGRWLIPEQIAATVIMVGVLIIFVTGLVWQTPWASRTPKLKPTDEPYTALDKPPTYPVTNPADIEWWKRWGPDSIALKAELSPDDFARMHHFELPVDKDTEIANLKAEVKRLLEDKDAASGVINTQVFKIKAHAAENVKYREHIVNLKAYVAAGEDRINDLCRVIAKMQADQGHGEIDRIEVSTFGGKVTHRLTNGEHVPVDPSKMTTKNFPGWQQNYGDRYGNDNFPESQELGA